PVVLALYRAPVSVEQPHDAPARWERIPLVAAAAAIVIVGIVPVSLLIEPIILALGGLP
ncbi:MAG: hypothetical protein GYB64_07290, partial [Chloroflexi bacterium]|nr:hypothetical protein [Chloroflexota bacterium]